ncbi:MAG TPA: Holliday junction resolvase-like protein [Methanoregulaceae archaeon]|nr:Holliday junction resolvase-like protein [Methanoregulaceae archaeon]
MIEWALLAAVIALIYIIWKYISLKDQVHSRASSLFEEWRQKNLEQEARKLASIYASEWKQKEERKIRRDAVEKSHAVIKGKITEHLLPFFPDFPYNPRDARFLGSPVDFVIFDGLDEGDLKKVVFIEVKTGKTGALTPREKMVRECIAKKSVEYHIIHQNNYRES